MEPPRGISGLIRRDMTELFLPLYLTICHVRKPEKELSPEPTRTPASGMVRSTFCCFGRLAYEILVTAGTNKTLGKHTPASLAFALAVLGNALKTIC